MDEIVVERKQKESLVGFIADILQVGWLALIFIATFLG